jgi:hypothetical protein
MVVRRWDALAATILAMAVTAFVRALTIALVAAMLVVLAATSSMAVAAVVSALCCSCRHRQTKSEKLRSRLKR